MSISKPVSELTLGVPHYYYDMFSFFGSSIYMGFWTAVLLVDASDYTNLVTWLDKVEILQPAF